MRLIDADLLTTEIIKISGVIPNFNEDVALCSVDSMPTVRAVPLVEFTCVQKQLILRNVQLLEAKEKMKSMVPVVRCKDCVYRQGGENPMCMLHTEPYPNARGYKGEAVCVEMNGFCSYGERKEGGAENG
nr:MAG TPA: hypothetical protein [Caudoviricetes sp.]